MRLGYLNALETADRMQPAELEAKTTRLQDKIARLREQMRSLDQIKERRETEPDGQLSVTDPDARSTCRRALKDREWRATTYKWPLTPDSTSS